MPAIDPAVLADLVAAVPTRLKRRLDAEPSLARAWAWTQMPDGGQVVTDGGETVSIRGERIAAPRQLACTCLLSPRCLHVLAVASLFEVAEPQAVPSEARSTAHAAPVDAVVALLPEQLAAAAALWRVAADTMVVGADGAGVVVHGQWLRAIHEARSVGLYAPAQAATQALRHLRASRAGDAAFSPSQLCDAWLQVLSAGRAARSGQLPSTALGVARQAYAASDGGSVRLHGLFCEPIMVAGLGGCATWLCDDKGQVWCLRDVRPSDGNNDAACRARQVAEAGIGWGGAASSHRQLSRGGLFVQGFSASAAGRLGGERAVRAVTADGTAWSAPPLAGLFDTPLAEQLARAWQTPVQREGDNLLFVRGAVVAADADGLVLARPGESWRLRARLTPGSAAAPLRDNLLQLAKTAGVEHWWIGRWTPALPAGMDPLAVGGPALSLPAQWAGRACLGYDRLQAAMMPAPSQPLVRASPVAHALPLSSVERWCQQVALAGSVVARQDQGAALHRDADRLCQFGMTGAAAVVRGLAYAAGGDADAVASAWLAAGVYLDAARKAHAAAEATA